MMGRRERLGLCLLQAARGVHLRARLLLWRPKR